MGFWKHMDDFPPTYDDAPGLQSVMLEFRAGKMFMEGKRVIPDTRKGLIRIGRGEEQLVHFQWIDRTTDTVEDDQIIFPDEAVYEKVTQTSGRVYILKFKTDDRKFFFWMQEPDAEGDMERCNSVNHYLNQPFESEDNQPDAPAPVPESEYMVEDDISSRAGNLIGSNLGGDVTSDVSSSSGPVKLADLQRILSNINPVGGTEDPDAGLGLGDILSPELIMPLMETLPVEERLSSHLPEGQGTPEDILEILQSPPFRQQVDSFTYVLKTGQIDLSQFGVDPSKYKFTVLSFLEALEDSVVKTSEPDDKDLRVQSCSGSGPMDESQ